MVSLGSYRSSKFIKMLLIGIPMSGKTGSLTSLVKAGYKLRILDFDSKLATLIAYVNKECPDKIGTIEARTLRDKYKATPLGPMVDGMPRAFISAISMLDKWDYEENGQKIALGVPATWGEDCILVVDSLTFLARSAFDWAEPLVPRSSRGEYDPRAVYGKAQDAVMDMLMLLTSDAFQTNVIVTAHVTYQDLPDGTMKGFPTSVGKAIGPNIPAMFTSMALCETVSGAHTIKTTSTALLDLANPAPFKMLPSLPLDTGMATFFKTIREATK